MLNKEQYHANISIYFQAKLSPNTAEPDRYKLSTVLVTPAGQTLNFLLH